MVRANTGQHRHQTKDIFSRGICGAGACFVVCVIVIATLASGCGLGSGNNDDISAQQTRDFAKLTETYRAVQGLYHGTLSTGDSMFPSTPGTLIIYYVQVDAGSNPDGTRRILPVLKSRFRLDKAVSDTDNVLMSGDYRAQTGILSLTSESQGGSAPGSGAPGGGGQGAQAPSPSGGASGSISMQGVLIGEVLRDLNIVRKGGPWGTFQGVRLTSDISSPVSGDPSGDRARLYAIYGAAEGRYLGYLVGPQGRRESLEIKLNIANGSDIIGQIAYLAGTFHFTAAAPGVANVSLVADNFDAFTGDIYLRQSPDPGGHFSLRGRIRNGVFNVEVRSFNGFEGNYSGVRQKM